ncbi:MAG: glycoside hydrolase family 3 N-terminal domain-containing protein [Trueperaceae bacterium]
MTRLSFAPILLLLTLSWTTVGAEGAALYLDPGRPVEERVADLLARMTLAEKVGQMTQINLSRLMGDGEWDRGPLNHEWLDRLLVEGATGSLLSGGGAAPLPNTPVSWAETINELQRIAVESTRLGIPILYGIDAVHGHNNVSGATIYPHGIGLAATFDRQLVESVAFATARDAAATGITWNFSPVADLGTDPRWGRFYETFGESPALAAELTAAHVRGQNRVARVASTLKHFVGYGQAKSGKDRAPADLSLRELRDTQLPAFAAGIRSGAQAVMANSGSLNSVPVHTSRFLLSEVLRNELGFSGPVLSDWGDVDKLVSVHRVAPDYEAAVAMAVNAGVDVVMVPHDGERFARALLRQVESGGVTRRRIDEAAGRVLALKFRLGLFEQPYVDAAATASIEGRGLGGGGLALRSALAGITLLENRRGALPLSDTQRLLVAGAGADDAAMQLGGWTIEWQGLASGDDRAPATTVLRGLREQAPAGAAVEPLPRLTAAAGPTALRADAVVLVLGEPPYAEGAGDSDTLRLPEQQLEQARLLVAGLEGLDAKLIVVLFAGRPILLPGWLTEASDALLMAYLPGSEGGSAVAQVLFGGVSPAGRLPFSWPREVGQLPLAGGALPAESRSEPRYRFGHGLSYTMFRYRNLRAEQVDAGVVLTVTVENTGDTAGDEVVLAFAGFPTLPWMTPDRVLAGFERVRLAPGEARDVSVAVPWTALALVPGDADAGGLPEVMAGEYRFEVGSSVSYIDLQRCMPRSCRQGGGSRE